MVMKSLCCDRVHWAHTFKHASQCSAMFMGRPARYAINTRSRLTLPHTHIWNTCVYFIYGGRCVAVSCGMPYLVKPRIVFSHTSSLNYTHTYTLWTHTYTAMDGGTYYNLRAVFDFMHKVLDRARDIYLTSLAFSYYLGYVCHIIQMYCVCVYDYDGLWSMHI